MKNATEEIESEWICRYGNEKDILGGMSSIMKSSKGFSKHDKLNPVPDQPGAEIRSVDFSEKMGHINESLKEYKQRILQKAIRLL